MNEKLLAMEAKEFGRFFDHTLLKPYISNVELEAFCQEGIKYGFKMLAVNPATVSFCKKMVSGHDVHVGAAIGFPLGQNTLETKEFETADAISKGSDEIDYVINIVALKNKDYSYIRTEMKKIITLCRGKNIISKVIFENCYLTDDEKKKLCEIANQVKPDFIKTSTGLGSGGSTVHDVELMRKYANEEIKIKASSGIKTLDDVVCMIQAGAERIGSSASVSIMEEFIRLKGER